METRLGMRLGIDETGTVLRALTGQYIGTTGKYTGTIGQYTGTTIGTMLRARQQCLSVRHLLQLQSPQVRVQCRTPNIHSVVAFDSNAQHSATLSTDGRDAQHCAAKQSTAQCSATLQSTALSTGARGAYYIAQPSTVQYSTVGASTVYCTV